MSDAIKNAYESRWDLRLGERLGYGRDGEVYVTNHNTAVKFCGNIRFSDEGNG